MIFNGFTSVSGIFGKLENKAIYCFLLVFTEIIVGKLWAAIVGSTSLNSNARYLRHYFLLLFLNNMNISVVSGSDISMSQ